MLEKESNMLVPVLTILAIVTRNVVLGPSSKGITWELGIYEDGQLYIVRYQKQNVITHLAHHFHLKSFFFSLPLGIHEESRISPQTKNMYFK